MKFIKYNKTIASLENVAGIVLRDDRKNWQTIDINYQTGEKFFFYVHISEGEKIFEEITQILAKKD